MLRELREEGMGKFAFSGLWRTMQAPTASAVLCELREEGRGKPSPYGECVLRELCEEGRGKPSPYGEYGVA